jgi:hypothetical protein
MLKFRFSLRWLVGACLKRKLQITPNFCKPLTKRNTRRRCEIISWVDGLSGRVASVSEKTSADTVQWHRDWNAPCQLLLSFWILILTAYFSCKTSCMVTTWDYLWSALRSVRFNLAERSLWYNWIGDFVCLSCDMHTGEDINLCPTGNVATVSGKSIP